MCKCCEFKVNNPRNESVDIKITRYCTEDGSFIYLLYQGEYEFLGEWNTDEAQIFYCPICGKKLK